VRRLRATSIRYRRHEAACRSFVTRLRSEFPGVHLYWSPSALALSQLRILRKDQMRFCENELGI
jgi:hypothetical protein